MDLSVSILGFDEDHHHFDGVGSGASFSNMT